MTEKKIFEIPLPSKVKLKNGGGIKEVIHHTLGGGVFVGDEMNPIFVSPKDFEVIEWIRNV